jgi:hypothetical protein
LKRNSKIKICGMFQRGKSPSFLFPFPCLRSQDESNFTRLHRFYLLKCTQCVVYVMYN